MDDLAEKRTAIKFISILCSTVTDVRYTNVLHLFYSELSRMKQETNKMRAGLKQEPIK